jgi:hypothetical protein
MRNFGDIALPIPWHQEGEPCDDFGSQQWGHR